ncbi:MAG: type II CAAX endopeptidase family protein [Cyanobacteria bacterium P01_H01_bin.119]
MSQQTAIARQAAPVRIGLFLLLLVGLWLPLAIPIQLLAWRMNSQQIPLAALGVLYIDFLVLLRWWRRRFYRQCKPLYVCGFNNSKAFWRQMLWAFAIGCGGVAALFGLMLLLGWAVLLPFQGSWMRLIGEGLLTAIAVGFCEEMFFRGWLLTELQQDYSPITALIVNSAVFAVAHFIRPLSVILATWPQGVGLFVLGAALVWAKRAFPQVVNAQTVAVEPGRPHSISHDSAGHDSVRHGDRHRQHLVGGLGAPIGLHAGLVWSYYLVNVGNLIGYSAGAKPWIVGIDRNPLAGLLGIVLLSAIAAYFRGIAIKVRTQKL